MRVSIDRSDRRSLHISRREDNGIRADEAQEIQHRRADLLVLQNIIPERRWVACEQEVDEREHAACLPAH